MKRFARSWLAVLVAAIAIVALGGGIFVLSMRPEARVARTIARIGPRDVEIKGGASTGAETGFHGAAIEVQSLDRALVLEQILARARDEMATDAAVTMRALYFSLTTSDEPESIPRGGTPLVLPLSAEQVEIANGSLASRHEQLRKWLLVRLSRWPDSRLMRALIERLAALAAAPTPDADEVFLVIQDLRNTAFANEELVRASADPVGDFTRAHPELVIEKNDLGTLFVRTKDGRFEPVDRIDIEWHPAWRPIAGGYHAPNVVRADGRKTTPLAKVAADLEAWLAANDARVPGASTTPTKR